MTRYELLIEFPDGNRQYLNTFTYEPISLNYDIANIKDISGRNSAYSKTIKLPDDAHNREMLGYITNLAVDSTVDANKIIKAWIMVDTICVFEGVLQLKKFDKNFKNGEFDIEVVVYADNDTFFTLMGDKYLTDMDFSEYDHIWASQSIVNSWTQSFENGYVYPLIDYGSNWVYKDVSGYGSGTLSVATMSVSVDEMFPSTYVRPIIDRIFISNGFSYQSEFFQTEEFKRLIIPFNETYIQGPTASDKEFRVGLYSYTHSFTPPANSSPALKLIVPYDNETTPNGDPNNLWNTSSFYFTNVDQLIYQRFGWFFDFTIPPDVGGYLWIHTYRSRDLNGATNSNWAGGTGNLVATRQIFYNNGSSYEGQWNPTTRRLLYGWRTPFINMFPGENLRVVVEFKFDNSPLIINESYLFNELASSIPVGGQILYNNCIPKKIKQKDFFLSLCKMFNLYIEPSKEYPNTLIVEPRDEYYANGTIKDWSRKLDLNQNIENDILAQTQDKIILYSHKEDKDAINQDYKSTFNEIYGQYEYNSPNEFAKATKKIETIFSPTPLVSLLGSFNFPIPVIVKDFLYSYNNNAAGRLQSNIRILYWGGLVNFAQYGVSDQFGFSNIIFPYYPYAGHLDNPYESNYDINFGQPEDIYFREPSNGLTDNNLFNNYWYKTMFELTNKDSRLLTANFYLTAEDIYKFKFSDKIYLEFDGNGQYYKVNKIFDYDPGTAKTCKIELIKSDEVQVNTFIPKYNSSKPGKTTRPNVASGNKVEGVGTGNVNGVGNQLDGSKTTINGDNNNVSGDTTNVFGDNNNVGGDTNIVNGDDNTVNSGTKTTITNGDDNFIDMGVGDTFINGDENKIYVQVDKSITSGDNNSVGTYSTNIYTYGDNNTIGTASQNIYTFGNNNTFADGVTSSFVIGDNTFVTQSNAVYISGNIIFSGTISGSFSFPGPVDPIGYYEGEISMPPDGEVDSFRNGDDGPYFKVISVDTGTVSLGWKSIIIDSGINTGNIMGSADEPMSSSLIIGGLDNIISPDNGDVDNTINNMSINSSGSRFILDSNTKFNSIISSSGVTMSTGVNHTTVIAMDNFTATESNTVYLPNVKFLGTVSGIGIGLKQVLDYNNIDDDTQFSIDPNNLVNLGRNSNFFSGATDSHFQNSQFSYIYDSISGSMNNVDYGFLFQTEFCRIDNARSELFSENVIQYSKFSNIGFSSLQSFIQLSTYSHTSFGESNFITDSSKSFIQNGSGNLINDLEKTGIMLLDNITATLSNTLYVPNVKALGDVYIDGDLYVNGASIAGQTGPQGFQGIMGVQGATFFGGPQGNVGSTGPQGFQGFQGFQGLEGAQGLEGSQGFQGFTGLQGFEGAQGFQGFQGITGFQGPTYTPPLWDVLRVGNRTDSQVLSMTGSNLILGSFTNSVVGDGRYNSIVGGNSNIIELGSGNLHGYNFIHGDTNKIYGIGTNPNDTGLLNFVHGLGNFLTYSVFNVVFGQSNRIKGTRFSGRNFLAGDSITLGSNLNNSAIFGSLHTLTGSNVNPSTNNFISGYNHGFTSSSYCGILAGQKHSVLGTTNSVILGGRNITALQNDTAYVPNLISKSDTPSSTVQSSAGTGATVSITGTNIAGSISITAGTGTGTGQILSATFSNSFSYPNGCSVVLFASNSLGASYGPLVYATGTTNAWSVFVTSPLSTGQTYTWNYQVIGY